MTGYISQKLRAMREEYPRAGLVKWVALDSAGNYLIQYKDKSIETYSKELSPDEVITGIVNEKHVDSKGQIAAS